MPSFLSRIANPSKAPIISVGAGKKIPRDSAPYLGSTVKSLPELLGKLADIPYALMKPPQVWKIHPLVVQDPFMYTHVSGFIQCYGQTLNRLYRIMQNSFPLGLQSRLRIMLKLQSERSTGAIRY